MLELGKTHPQYLPSSILTKKIKNFNDHAQTLLPLLRSSTNFLELDTSSSTIAKSFKELCAAVEPTILNLISHGNEEI